VSDSYRTVAERAAARFEVQGSEFIGHVAAVVTRYYGGTNLGVGGLARSYSRAVTEGVDAAGVVESVSHERFTRPT
jgi:putative IMPACT (imprinted ancient) family translation regulator